MVKICKNNIFRLFIGGLLRIAEDGELKATMQSLYGWSDEKYKEYLNIFIEKWNDIPDDTLTEEEQTMWIARDKDGTLWRYPIKPEKDKELNRWVVPDNCSMQDAGFRILLNSFPEVKWEDEEPRELILKPIKDE